MRPSATVTFCHMDHSNALESRARELGQWLQRYGEQITHSRMTLERLLSSHASNDPYSVQFDVAVPDVRIHADSLRFDSAGYQDIHAALRDAFNNAKRQLQEVHSRRFKLNAGAAMGRPVDMPNSGTSGAR
jgi:hypothetical protein